MSHRKLHTIVHDMVSGESHIYFFIATEYTCRANCQELNMDIDLRKVDCSPTRALNTTQNAISYQYFRCWVKWYMQYTKQRRSIRLLGAYRVAKRKKGAVKARAKREDTIKKTLKAIRAGIISLRDTQSALEIPSSIL